MTLGTTRDVSAEFEKNPLVRSYAISINKIRLIKRITQGRKLRCRLCETIFLGQGRLSWASVQIFLKGLFDSSTQEGLGKAKFVVGLTMNFVTTFHHFTHRHFGVYRLNSSKKNVKTIWLVHQFKKTNEIAFLYILLISRFPPQILSKAKHMLYRMSNENYGNRINNFKIWLFRCELSKNRLQAYSHYQNYTQNKHGGRWTFDKFNDERCFAS